MSKYVGIDQLFTCETCLHLRSGRCNTHCSYAEAYTPMFSLLETIDSDSIQQWISINDKMPVMGRRVLATQNGEVVVAMRSKGLDGGICWTDGMLEFCAITHWQPLPEPPEDAGEE